MSKKVTDQQIIDAIRSSKTYTEAMRKCGLSDKSNFRQRRISIQEEYGIDLRNDQVLENDAKDSMDDQIIELKLKDQIAQLRSENKVLQKEVMTSQNIEKLVHEVKQRPYKEPQWINNPETSNSCGTPTLFLSDIHYGEIVDPKQINNSNTFNTTICNERLERVFTSAIDISRDIIKKEKAQGFVLALGGDMLSGNIHEELRENSDMPVLECVVHLRDQIITGIDRLIAEYKNVFIPCVTGNHGRIDKKPRAKGGTKDNYEWILYQMLKDHYKDNLSVTFMIPDGPDAIYTVHGHTYLLTHGDQFKGGAGIAGPMTPWALGNHKKRKKQSAIGMPYDTMIMGHFHTLFYGPDFIVNGSVKGYDEWTSKMNFPYERPQQALWMTHPEHGITIRAPIFADKSVKRTEKIDWITVPQF